MLPGTLIPFPWPLDFVHYSFQIRDEFLCGIGSICLSPLQSLKASPNSLPTLNAGFAISQTFQINCNIQASEIRQGSMNQLISHLSNCFLTVIYVPDGLVLNPYVMGKKDQQWERKGSAIVNRHDNQALHIYGKKSTIKTTVS